MVESTSKEYIITEELYNLIMHCIEHWGVSDLKQRLKEISDNPYQPDTIRKEERDRVLKIARSLIKNEGFLDIGYTEPIVLISDVELALNAIKVVDDKKQHIETKTNPLHDLSGYADKVWKMIKTQDIELVQSPQSDEPKYIISESQLGRIKSVVVEDADHPYEPDMLKNIRLCKLSDHDDAVRNELITELGRQCVGRTKSQILDIISEFDYDSCSYIKYIRDNYDDRNEKKEI